MQNDNKLPSRRIEAEINIGADSWRDLHDSLHAIIRELFDAAPNNENMNWVSVTERSGIDLCVKVNPFLEHAQIVKDLPIFKDLNVDPDEGTKKYLAETKVMLDSIFAQADSKKSSPHAVMEACGYALTYIGVSMLRMPDRAILDFIKHHLKSFSTMRELQKANMQ